ncbi:hypothetical protein [Paractinoplanes atraurantiacus]|uniref:DUF2637 domain-containing protein n=1 Tax=Paractinoplanes atraurantiacus TaxID=1036182 RepID=A0A285KJF3_9ACTN|nr:hypothetical protein [Actinoplanes atraurantiacus]SNY72754.1 hypothetical protein SAMN05421748_1445 [Actinoplanes atraurantiacus]
MTTSTIARPGGTTVSPGGPQPGRKPPPASPAPSPVRAEQLRKRVEQAKAKSDNINRATWGVAAGVMIYGTVNVTMLLVEHHVPWQIAPLLSLMVDLGLCVALWAAPVLAEYGRKSGWVNVLRWVTALMSWGLNVAEPALARDWVGVGIHSCGPVLLIVVAEAGAALQRTLAEIVAELDAELATAQQAVPKGQQALADLQAEIARLAQELAETQARAEAEAARAGAEIQARAEAETRVTETATRAETEAGKQAEILRQARAEIEQLKTAVQEAVAERDEARRHAGEQTQAAGLAQGRLAEARDSAERAAAAQVAAEQQAQEHMRQVSSRAEQAEHQLRQELAKAAGQASTAEATVGELTEQLRRVQAQLDEARTAGERQGTAKVLADLKIIELEKGRDAALTELERVRRQLARATEKAETAVERQPEISRAPVRKSAALVPAGLAENLPVSVDTVAPETVATVLIAWAENPNASQAELAKITGISDRTIRKVLRAIPAEIAGELAGQVLALTGGRAG